MRRLRAAGPVADGVQGISFLSRTEEAPADVLIALHLLLEHAQMTPEVLEGPQLVVELEADALVGLSTSSHAHGPEVRIRGTALDL